MRTPWSMGEAKGALWGAILLGEKTAPLGVLWKFGTPNSNRGETSALPKTNSNSTCQAETPKGNENLPTLVIQVLTGLLLLVSGSRVHPGDGFSQICWGDTPWAPFEGPVFGIRNTQENSRGEEVEGKLRKFQFVAFKQIEHQSEKRNLERHGISFN